MRLERYVRRGLPSALLALTFALVASPALFASEHGSGIDLELVPSTPDRQTFWLRAVIPYAGSSPPVLRRVDLGQNEIRVALEWHDDGATGFGEWKLEAALGRLEPGIYTVILEMNGDVMGTERLDVGLSALRCRWRPDLGDATCFGNRFQVSARWWTRDGAAGEAHAVPLTEDSVAFWFFRPGNIELTVKVLDACGPFDRFWVFASGLTDVGVELTVTDTLERESRVYRSPPGKGFESIRDTDAFATCF